MFMLILGLVAFPGIHFVPVFPQLRSALALRLSENTYKGMFSAVSGIGLVLIVAGYAYAPRAAQLFEPVAAAKLLAPVAMIASFILLATANMKSHIRRALKHPMLLGVPAVAWGCSGGRETSLPEAAQLADLRILLTRVLP